jgi:hypothetical protein
MIPLARRSSIVTAALLPLFCSSCGNAEKYRTPMMKCLRHVENHTTPALRIEVAKRECGWSPRRKAWASLQKEPDG